MQLLKFFKMLIGFANFFIIMLPALVLRGIVPGACPIPDTGSQPLYSRNTMQLQRSHSNTLTKYILFAFLSFIITQNTKAQSSYTDSNYVDTTSMKNAHKTVEYNDNETYADTAVMDNENESSNSYDDNEEGYVDTTVKHIYDTSQYFFNWKEYLDDPYTTTKITQRHLLDSSVNQLKTEDDFWYIPTIEKMERRMKTDTKYRDSLLKIKNHDNHLMVKNDYDFLYI